MKRGREDGMLRVMAPTKLVETIPILQSQIDCLLEFDAHANELTNVVINSCFLLLFKVSVLGQ